MKVKTKKVYLRRLRLILGSELSAQNKVKAINSFAVLVPQYSLGLVNWWLLEIKQLDKKTRKMLTSYKFHHPKDDVEPLYIPRCSGLIELESAYEKIDIILCEALQSCSSVALFTSGFLWVFVSEGLLIRLRQLRQRI